MTLSPRIGGFFCVYTIQMNYYANNI
jgi:hypothetical protein